MQGIRFRIVIEKRKIIDPQKGILIRLNEVEYFPQVTSYRIGAIVSNIFIFIGTEEPQAISLFYRFFRKSVER